MKKSSYIIIILIVIAFGFLYLKSTSKTPVDPSITTYKNSSIGLSFDYPKIITASSTTDSVILHHEVPFTHHDYCDFKGEGTTTIPTLTDFDVSFHFQNKGLVGTMKTESPYIPQENFVGETVVPSPGFIDTFEIGSIKGYKIFEGAEGCGQTTYYFPVSKNKTLVVKQALITVFTGAIDFENKSAAEAVPGVLNKEKADEIFNSVLESIKTN